MNPLLKKLSNLDIRIKKSLHYTGVIILLSLAAAAIWYAGPYISYGDYFPLAQQEKRLYLILLVFLTWFFKILIVDLTIPNPFQHKSNKLRKKLIALQKRFSGATKFLNKTTITKNNKKIRLSSLPCYLVLGPAASGKSTLLANSEAPFILQKQYHQEKIKYAATSENCDWWVTREACMIDVPGKYLSTYNSVDKINPDDKFYLPLWTFFLRLMKKKFGRHGIKGIILTLPAPEIIKLNEQKNYHHFIRDMFQRIQELQKMFATPIACQLVITKCDLIPGFAEFFAEMSNEETTQTFGVSLSLPKEGEKLVDNFTVQFNALIKNLNQQLLWRLHQERNPDARPLIKDFPLQIEHLKEFIADFIKKLTIIRLNLVLKGVYLTSSLQPEFHSVKVTDHSTLDANAQVIQIFKEPISASQTYFSKSFFTDGISEANMTTTSPSKVNQDHLKLYTAYAASAGFIAFSTIFLVKDFRFGVSQYYSLQQDIAEYQHKIAKVQNPAAQLLNTLNMLDALQKSFDSKEFRFDLSYLFTLYSHEARQKAELAYQNTLHNILLPQIKNYFEEYLENPGNKNMDDIYSVLKAYLMMGDAKHFEAQHITSTLQKILPKSMKENENESLIRHLNTTLASFWSPMTLNAQKIRETRIYLTALAPEKLSYLILRNMDNNNLPSKIQIEEESNNLPIFANQHLVSQIPVFFTAQMFNTVLSKQIEAAANEANTGNWVIGTELPQKSEVLNASILPELRIRYVTQYIETWESLLENIRLTNPADLAATDYMITSIIGSESPLLHFLKIVHDNTNLEAVNLSSSKLQRINSVVEKNSDTSKTLYTIFASMQSLHQYLHGILHADNIKQAAYNAISSRMQIQGKPDVITQLRVIAETCPTPIRQWLLRLTDSSWNCLMQEAGQYLDLSWNSEVLPYYHAEIAGRYPFNGKGEQEVEFQKFTRFFGTAGIIPGFYNKYLQRFVDTSTADWHWKQIDGKPLPFSVETLRQIQYAMRIHQSFFPKGDNKLYVQFALQPYKFGKVIKSVQITMNDEKFTDSSDSGNLHLVTLDGGTKTKMTSIKLTLDDDKTISREFPGHWGWYKLLNQSFESAITKKELLVNLSMNEHPAKYILSSASQYNPFLAMNLQLFHLPQQLTDEKV